MNLRGAIRPCRNRGMLLIIGSTLQLPAPHDTLPTKIAARLGHESPLTGMEAIMEGDDDPVVRLAQPMRQCGVREQSPKAPTIAIRDEQRQPRFMGGIKAARRHQRQTI